MKTPRQVLLERHAHENTTLDRLRERALASFSADLVQPDGDPATQPALLPQSRYVNSQIPRRGSAQSEDEASALAIVWRELFWNTRKAWTGLAVGGLVVLGLNVAAPRPDAPTIVSLPAPAPAMARAAAQQRARLMAELLDPFTSPPTHQLPPESVPPSTGKQSGVFTHDLQRLV